MMWHLSAVPLGPRVVLRPRIPRDPAPFENRTVPRICVASTLAGCVAALRTTYYAGAFWYCYRVLAVAPTVEPIAVPDARRTGERWILDPAEVQFAGLLSGHL